MSRHHGRTRLVSRCDAAAEVVDRLREENALRPESVDRERAHRLVAGGDAVRR